jgi:rSAM/selenodomain-associated transferase 2
MAPRLSIVIPTLNEAATIEVRLAALKPLRHEGIQIIIADGGSSDSTVARATAWVDLLIDAPRGRAAQMNAGARHAIAPALLFLHADTALPDAAISLIEHALQQAAWGRFDIYLSGTHPMLRVIAAMMNWRSRLTGIATGDQAIFVRRSVFEQLNGFAPIALMEDIELCRRIKKISAPACLRQRVISSGRRWQQHGVWRTIWLMWRLRLAYFLGAGPHDLAVRYGYLPQLDG